MRCPTCEAHVLGADCPQCGAAVIKSCPDCQQAFLACDSFCHNCGRELRFINFTNHATLRSPRAVNVTQYEYPADRSVRTIMAGLWPIKVVARYGIEKLSQPTLHGSLLGSTVKVSNKQFPAIKRAGDVCMEMLAMSGIEIFISRSTALAAAAHGVGGRNFLVITSGLAETLDYDEMLFILGREMGHIKSDHLLYLSIIATLKQGVGMIPMLGPTLQELMTFVLLPWQRSSELTADRAGLICCQSIQTATKALTKIALGSRDLFEKVDLDEFLRQYQDLQEQGSWGEYMQVNPFVLTRIRMLQGFIESPAWQRLFDGSYHPHRPYFSCHYCDATYVLTDFTAKLKEISCSSCQKKLFIDRLFCPHCGFHDELTDRDVTVDSFVCSACNRPYFMNDERAIATAWNHSLPESSAYRTLDVPFTATTDDIASGYVSAMRPVAGEALPITKRVAIDRAYRTLINSRLRMRHDRALSRALHAPPKDTPSAKVQQCHQCQLECHTNFCSSCGAKQSSRTEVTNEPVNRMSAEYGRFKKALVSDSAFGDGLVFFRDAPFDLAFKVSPHTYYVTFAERALDCPSAILEVIQACNTRSETISRQSWLHASAHFVIIAVSPIDVSLLKNLIDRHFVAKRGMAGSFLLDVVSHVEDGTMKIVHSSHQTGTEQTKRNISIQPVQQSVSDYEALASYLANDHVRHDTLE